MNPTRRRRLLFVLLLVAAAAVAATLAAFALQRNATYLYTPSEVLQGDMLNKAGGAHARFRLGGVVCAGSFKRAPGSLHANFRVTDRANFVPVGYDGILPDLFREGQSIIATGHMDGGRFVADEVLAKHDETYMPKEVAEKMQQAMARPRDAGCGAN